MPWPWLIKCNIPVEQHPLHSTLQHPQPLFPCSITGCLRFLETGLPASAVVGRPHIKTLVYIYTINTMKNINSICLSLRQTVIRKMPANKLKALHLFLFSAFCFPLSVPQTEDGCFSFVLRPFSAVSSFSFILCVCCALTLSLMLIDDVDWKDWCDEPIIKSGPSLSPSSCGGSACRSSVNVDGAQEKRGTKFENCGNVEKLQQGQKETHNFRDEVRDLLTVTHILAKLQSWGRVSLKMEKER